MCSLRRRQEDFFSSFKYKNFFHFGSLSPHSLLYSMLPDFTLENDMRLDIIQHEYHIEETCFWPRRERLDFCKRARENSPSSWKFHNFVSSTFSNFVVFFFFFPSNFHFHHISLVFFFLNNFSISHSIAFHQRCSKQNGALEKKMCKQFQIVSAPKEEKKSHPKNIAFLPFDVLFVIR